MARTGRPVKPVHFGRILLDAFNGASNAELIEVSGLKRSAYFAYMAKENRREQLQQAREAGKKHRKMLGKIFDLALKGRPSKAMTFLNQFTAPRSTRTQQQQQQQP